MSVTKPTSLETYLKAFGNAFILVGDPFTASGLSVLGFKEGDITVNWNEDYNELTFPEQTGPTIWERRLRGLNIDVQIPMIVSDETLFASVSPTGESNAGHDFQQPVTETSLVLVAEADFGAGPWAYPQPSGPWTPQAPVATAWFWRGHFTRPIIKYRDEDHGKNVETVSFQVMRAKDAMSLPEGHRMFTLGDPVTQGITTIDI